MRPDRPEGCSIDDEDKRPDLSGIRGNKSINRPNIPRAQRPDFERPGRPEIPDRPRPRADRPDQPSPRNQRPETPSRPDIEKADFVGPNIPDGPQRPDIPAPPKRAERKGTQPI